MERKLFKANAKRRLEGRRKCWEIFVLLFDPFSHEKGVNDHTVFVWLHIVWWKYAGEKCPIVLKLGLNIVLI